jgi:MFS family permease
LKCRLESSPTRAAQIAGGLLVPYAGVLFSRRTSLLLAGTALSAALLVIIGLAPRFSTVIVLLVLWGLIFAAMMPVRQAYLNGLIASSERATVLSFDSLLGSGGAVVIQPILGRVADVWSYPTSYVCAGAIQVLAVPFIWIARSQETLAPRRR